MKFKVFVAALTAVLILSFCAAPCCFASPILGDDDTEILPAFEKGDANLDSKVDIRDVTAIQKYLAKITSFNTVQKDIADIDENGYVSIKDATYIQKLIAGLIDSDAPIIGGTPSATDDEPIILPVIPAP